MKVVTPQFSSIIYTQEKGKNHLKYRSCQVIFDNKPYVYLNSIRPRRLLDLMSWLQSERQRTTIQPLAQYDIDFFERHGYVAAVKNNNKAKIFQLDENPEFTLERVLSPVADYNLKNPNECCPNSLQAMLLKTKNPSDHTITLDKAQYEKIPMPDILESADYTTHPAFNVCNELQDQFSRHQRNVSGDIALPYELKMMLYNLQKIGSSFDKTPFQTPPTTINSTSPPIKEMFAGSGMDSLTIEKNGFTFTEKTFV